MEVKTANFVADLAHLMVENKVSMPITTLVTILNHNHFTTKKGKESENGRFISSLYDYFKELGYNQAADDIAVAFVRANGNYTFEND